MRKINLIKDFLGIIDWKYFLTLLVRCPIIVIIICIIFDFNLIMSLWAIFLSTCIWGFNLLFTAYRIHNRIKNNENFND